MQTVTQQVVLKEYVKWKHVTQKNLEQFTHTAKLTFEYMGKTYTLQFEK